MTTPRPETTNNLSFVKEVAKYFMDFLETDFHKRKNPRRSVKLRDGNNFLIGLNLAKYPSFSKEIWKLLGTSFSAGTSDSISKGVYRTNLPKNLLELIELQVSKIQLKVVNSTITEIAEQLERQAVLHKEEYDQAIIQSLEIVSSIIKTNLVLPFVSGLEKPIENLGIGDENDIFLMEEELTEILTKPLEDQISEILKRLILEEKLNISKELKTTFDIDEIKNYIATFFKNYEVGDLFAELFEIDQNRTILDKQDFYLYFCDISFNKVKYPIFYTPFTLIRSQDTFQVTFDSQIYINKRALEFVVQEYNSQNGTRGNLKSVTDRIIYISQHKDDLREFLSSIVSELTHHFDLDKSIDLANSEPQNSRSLLVRVSNSAYIALFDKSDESLVNDYEEILQELNSEEGNLAGLFNILIDDFIHKNPEAVNPKVEKEWDDRELSEKLVAASPIPLNSEQIQILSAIREPNSKYLIVEGPPGTGKSHTITAIIFDAILRNQSVLVLSDKKEALDVVERNITQTMDKVRFGEENFQNPILRLGKTGNTYSQILARPTMERIKAHHRAFRQENENLGDQILKQENSLKEDIEAEALAYSEIDLKEVREYYELESYYETHLLKLDLDELSKDSLEYPLLAEFREFLRTLPTVLDNKQLDVLLLPLKEVKSLGDLLTLINLIISINDEIQEVRKKFNTRINSVIKFREFSDTDLTKLRDLYTNYSSAKLPVVGFLLQGSKIEKLNSEFRMAFPFAEYSRPQDSLSEIKEAIECFEYLNALKDRATWNMTHLDYLDRSLKLLIKADELQELSGILFELRSSIKSFERIFDQYPETLKKLGIEMDDFSTWLENELVSMTEYDFERVLKFAWLYSSLKTRFENIPQLSYLNQKKEIENLITAQVTHLLDSRLIDFYTNNLNDAQTLRDVISEKKKFPKEQFAKLKEAFPCILAGIRDYAEYIPLESGLFDLVIIDEASQVSIAQAFPALIRAKKVLILGDRKQFSNIKAAQARSETNREYLNQLSKTFKESISNEDSKLIKLAKFDIKTSILEFFEFISNYDIQLQKHFRGYKEIISYSNRYFYKDSLQVMKIRSKNINEVIRFDFIEHDDRTELTPNTNPLEVEHIISKLREMNESGKDLTVGIITPHTNQQKLLIDEISKLPEKDFYFDKLKLKIMTFDTCQGEERDIIFYSMVASEVSDKLWGVFPTDSNSVDSDEEGSIKLQRLNVGFSRAKECVHFVLSKPLDKFSGAIGDALRHYWNTLQEAKKEYTAESTDSKSKKEPEVLNWFYQTEFWKNHKDQAEFVPQFDIGKYLKQLDRTYQHPNYKVDFLLTYSDETSREHKIIFEYDGFAEHFKNLDEVNQSNYKDYYSEGDLYRQKVLESYGYKFIRINKFNVGKNPIATLDERISDVLKNRSIKNQLIDEIHETFDGLQNGQKKECPKCKEIRDKEDFKDAHLTTGYGRFCKFCKQNKKIPAVRIPPTLSNEICPRCGSKMILRDSSRGKFYGCSRFPNCRGTKNV